MKSFIVLSLISIVSAQTAITWNVGWSTTPVVQTWISCSSAFQAEAWRACIAAALVSGLDAGFAVSGSSGGTTSSGEVEGKPPSKRLVGIQLTDINGNTLSENWKLIVGQPIIAVAPTGHLSLLEKLNNNNTRVTVQLPQSRGLIKRQANTPNLQAIILEYGNLPYTDDSNGLTAQAAQQAAGTIQSGVNGAGGGCSTLSFPSGVTVPIGITFSGTTYQSENNMPACYA